jgi:hypothetical protein
MQLLHLVCGWGGGCSGGGGELTHATAAWYQSSVVFCRRYCVVLFISFQGRRGVLRSADATSMVAILCACAVAVVHACDICHEPGFCTLHGWIPTSRSWRMHNREGGGLVQAKLQPPLDAAERDLRQLRQEHTSLAADLEAQVPACM